jgi:methionyl-tRNA formyltransferase
MKIVFFGTSHFSTPSLKRIISSGHELAAVVTQPDRKKGRSLRLSPPPVKEAMAGSTVPIYQPEKMSAPGLYAALEALEADLFCVVAFGHILKRELLEMPKHFAVNLHASLLPKYRGAAPINWAIANGESVTGVTTMRMSEGMDEGDLIRKREMKIAADDTAETLGKKLSESGAGLLMETIDLIDKGEAQFTKQDPRAATYAAKLRKEDGLIDWSMAARDIHNRVRGFAPWPGAYTHWNGKVLKITGSRLSGSGSAKGDAGRVLRADADSLAIGTGSGELLVTELQLEGAKRLPVAAFLRGHKITPDTKLT